MNKLRRKFLGKVPAVVIGAGVGISSGKIAMAAQSDLPEGTRPLLDFMIDGQRKINGRLYAANELMLEVLQTIVPHVPIDQAVAIAKLAEADGYIGGSPAMA